MGQTHDRLDAAGFPGDYAEILARTLAITPENFLSVKDALYHFRRLDDGQADEAMEMIQQVASAGLQAEQASPSPADLAEPVPNTNCLEGIKCPDCGNEDTFRIAGTTIFTVTDEGTEDHGDVEWNDDSHAECAECGREGPLKEFAKNSFKVWVEIERINERSGESEDMDAPGSSLATFGTYKQAWEYAQRVTRLAEGINPIMPDTPLPPSPADLSERPATAGMTTTHTLKPRL